MHAELPPRVPRGFLDPLTSRSSIRRALLVILAFALLPLALLALIQGLAGLKRDERESAQQLGEAAQLAALTERGVIGGADELLTLLASDPRVTAGTPETCRARFATAARLYPAYSHFSLVGADGRIRCALLPEALGASVVGRAWWPSVSGGGGFIVTAPVWGRFSESTVLWAILPLSDTNGRFAGAITASIDVGRLHAELRQRHLGRDAVVLIVDQAGTALAASRPVAFGGIRFDGPPDTIRHLRDALGQEWRYATAPLYEKPGWPQSFHVVYAAPHHRLFGPDWWYVASYFTLPIVALLLASAAIWIGANQAILRWVTALRAFAGEIAQGRYRDYEDRFGEAPTEVRDLAADLFRMARTLDERDRRLLEGLDRQQALARELHHRVRNNLQIIASFLSLQADTAEPGARAALDHARLRVSALALVHRLLYAGGELAQVSTRDLIGQVCNLVGQYAHRAAPEVSCDIADLPVEIDTAVPLTLWTLEAIGLLLDGATDARQARLGVQFSVEGDRAHLSVEADGSGGGTVPENNSARLVRSIGRQLGGDARIAGGARRTVALDMPLARLTARSAPGGTKPLP